MGWNEDGLFGGQSMLLITARREKQEPRSGRGRHEPYSYYTYIPKDWIYSCRKKARLATRELSPQHLFSGGLQASSQRFDGDADC
jgi:hypothetical protein